MNKKPARSMAQRTGFKYGVSAPDNDEQKGSIEAMQEYTEQSPSAQPIRDCFKRILLQTVANASPKSEQKEMILILNENGIINTADTFALIHIYGLAGE